MHNRHWRSQDFQSGGGSEGAESALFFPSPYVLHAMPVFAWVRLSIEYEKKSKWHFPVSFIEIKQSAENDLLRKVYISFIFLLWHDWGAPPLATPMTTCCPTIRHLRPLRGQCWLLTLTPRPDAQNPSHLDQSRKSVWLWLQGPATAAPARAQRLPKIHQNSKVWDVPHSLASNVVWTVKVIASYVWGCQ